MSSGRRKFDMMRQALLELGATPMVRLRDSGWVRTGGLIVARQKPGTAKGFAFFVLEDGVHRLQVVISPDLWEREMKTFRDSRVLIAGGRFEKVHRAMTLRARRVVGLDGPVQVRGYHYGG